MYNLLSRSMGLPYINGLDHKWIENVREKWHFFVVNDFQAPYSDRTHSSYIWNFDTYSSWLIDF